ncbi:autotransporter domain-containing protein [Altericroceibacterium xinjiangense]|uniref:autotransporter domain-containing protein n=1 Tax=Altericroceibacterium xinjiangense TaxID=762261 RepID=UPI0013DF57B6|nr:autotransporter domain-containing protein [Altericroceibacterium xinjiangense]
MNPEGSTIEGAEIGIFAAGGGLDLTNAGTVRGNGTSDSLQAPPGAGVAIAREGSRVVNTGSISGAGAGVTTAYYLNASTGALEGRAIGTRVENSGSIIGDSNDGVRLIGGGAITNSGLIAGRNGTYADGISMYAFMGQDTADQSSIGTVTNTVGGEINGQRFGIILSGGGDVTNSGTITGDLAAIRIQGDETSAKTASVINQGVLTGGVSIGYEIDSAAITNSGTIVAAAGGSAIAAFANTVKIDNSGTVTSATSEVYAVEALGLDTLEMSNSGTIEARDAVFAAAAGTSLTFVNSGTIRAPSTEEESGHAVTLATGYDQVTGMPTIDAETAYFENTADGLIEGEISLDFAARSASFVNSGTIIGLPGDSVLDFNVYSHSGNAESFSFENSGQISGSIEAELLATNVTFANSGSIVAMAGDDSGEPALDIENVSTASNSVSFTNAAGGSIASNGAGGIGLIVQSAAGLLAPDGDGGEPTVSDDPSIMVAISVVNDGSIVANDGGEVVDITDWGIPGKDTMVSFGGGAGIIGLAPQSEASLTNGAAGVIEATGAASIAVFADAGRFTLNNAGTIAGTTGTAIADTMFDGGDYSVIEEMLALGKTSVAGAIQTLGSIDVITNAGTIIGSVDLASGDDTFVNSGVVRGNVSMGTGDDLVQLAGGSDVEGVFHGGEGRDTFELAGTSGTFTNLQTVAASAQFEELLASSGYWVASGNGTASAFDRVVIGEGATLHVRETAIGGAPASAIVTDDVVTNGLLILDFNSDALADIDHLAISGTGGVTLAGEANFLVDQNTLTYTGLSTIANGSLTLVGDGRLAGDVRTTGDGTFILGDGGTTGTFEGDLVNDGHFVLNRSDSYDFLGDFSGTGSFLKMGAGTLTFTGLYSYTGTTVIDGGKVQFTGQIDPETEIDLQEGMFDVSGTPQTIGQLAGTKDSTIVVDNSQLTVNQSTSTAFAGSITGDGSLVKTGSGTLNLTGNSTYTGPTVVDGGALAVNGSITSVVTVNEGGTLKGNGTIGGATVGSNGMIAPGNSIGTLRVAGDITFAANSIYEVEVNAAGESDQILATGSALLQGGTVAVLADTGAYRPFTEYLIIRADSGVSGTFGNVTSNFAFLDPTLTYGANTVSLQLVRNDIDFAAVAASANQASTGAALEGLGVRNDLYGDIAMLSQAGARQAFDALSGEAYAGISSGLVADSRHVVNALLQAGRNGGGTGVWAQALGDWGRFDDAPGVAEMDTEHQGILGGIDFGRQGLSAGVAFGTSNTDYDVRQRASRAEVDTTIAGARIGYSAGPVSAQVGGAYAWHDVNANRSVVFPTFSETTEAGYDASTTQFFGELGYRVAYGLMMLEPFARLEHVRVRTDGFEETGGGVASLTLDEDVRKVQFGSLGLRAAAGGAISPGVTLEPHVSAAWRHGWGDLAGRSRATLSGGTTGFDILGSRIAKDALDLDMGLTLRSGSFRIGAAYRGLISDRWNSDGAQVTVGFTF